MFLANSFPLGEINNIKKHPEDYRLLEQVAFSENSMNDFLPCEFAKPVANDTVRKMAIVEINNIPAHVADMAVIGFSYCTLGKYIVSIDRVYYGYNTSCLKRLGVNIASLPDKDFRSEDDTVWKENTYTYYNSQYILDDCDVVLTNNPKFMMYCKFIKKYKCYCVDYTKDIQWSKFGCSSSNLDFILQSFGLFYDQSTTLNKVYALSYLFVKKPSIFASICDSAKATFYLVVANSFQAYHIKEHLKQQGFVFDSNQREWYKKVNTSLEVEQTRAVLNSLYSQYEISGKVDVQECNYLQYYPAVYVTY